MKRPTMLFQALLAQASMELGLSTERDFVTLRNRFEHEGLSFLTITLPRLSDALEEGIETGWFSLPFGFRKGRGRLPAFMQGFFNRVFDEGGSLLQNACGESIYWIRQVTRFFKKPKLSCSPARERRAIHKFREVEEDLYHATQSINRRDEILDSVSAILWSSVFPTVDYSSIVCGHGPGVTADRRLSNERRRIRYWYDRAEGSFSSADHAFHNWGAAAATETGEGCRGLDYKGVGDEPAVRVVFVPKTLTTPRVIAIEPSSMQFMQQGLSRFMVATLERHNLTSGSVNFTDQSVNQELAYSASLDRSLATLDLSDASDRVHLELVQRMFRRSGILEALEDLRSLHADLPDGSNILLKKYASMGSALCFPVEACVFYTLILSAIFRSTGDKPNYRSITALKKVVKVYGDDLIVPVKYVDTVCDYLESYGLRVNRRKSFSASAFRESCGSDFYNGVSVKPIYARMDCPERSSEWTPEHVMSWTSTANQFYLAGYWKMAEAVRAMVASTVVTQIPISRHFDVGVCFASYFQERNLRFDPQTQSWRQRRIVFQPIKTKDEIDGDYTACYNLVFDRLPETAVDPFNGQRRSSVSERTSKFNSPSLQALSGLLRREYFDDTIVGIAAPEQPRKPYTFSGRLLFREARCLYVNGYRSYSGVDEVQGSPLDFHFTVKRGAFKPKRRWVTIVS